MLKIFHLRPSSLPFFNNQCQHYKHITYRRYLSRKYAILLKLGYGSVSTAWLCRNLEHAICRTRQYVTLKVYTRGHRQALDEVEFELQGELGPHTCIVHSPLSLSMRDIRSMAGRQIPSTILRPMVYGLLLGLDYLHSEAHIVHTDIQEGNIMLSIQDDSIVVELVEQEREQPSPQKRDGDRTICSSVELDMPEDPAKLSFATSGTQNSAKALSTTKSCQISIARPRSSSAYIPWNEKIDIWSFGLMTAFGLLDRSRIRKQYFDAEGHLKIDACPEIMTTTLEEEEESVLEGAEKDQFLAFMSKTLQWRPEDRATAKQLLQDPWVVSWAA
ncbi:hypothetical protein CERZMDRAFT_113333 [Cercospora zeae-maydis SCOH1-5]|uniref:non-specific serine/threonine protein kinase n=1 Tax=Cercospora zeae-maydis SCOH1-5 TaxID=717836 RepID=A0A6A6FAT5_9PEZI|nr:hypothetical protein CERZMDRAFT_113333 [Cercospora zeae-maydis SCOH1-5]